MVKFIFVSLCSFVIAGSIAIVDRRSTDVAPAPSAGQEIAPPSQIYASGIVEGRTEAVELRPETSGRAVKVLISEGDWVEQGAVLVRFDNRVELQHVAASLANLRLAEANLQRLINGAREAERREARSLLAAKEAQLAQSLLTWGRIKALRAQDAVAQQDADDREAAVRTLSAEVQAAKAKVEQLELPAREDEVRAAEARVSAAQADYELAKIALDKTELRAPFRGQVLDVDIEAGELVSNDQAHPIVVLADTSVLCIRAYIEEIDAPRLVPGAQATVTADGLQNQSFAAAVRFLSPRMQRKVLTNGQPDELFDTKVREVLLTLQERENLLIGLRVDVTINAETDGSCPAPLSDHRAHESDSPPDVQARSNKIPAR
jgi:multidrug resistance efflux pump